MLEIPISFVYHPEYRPRFYDAGTRIDIHDEPFMTQYINETTRQWPEISSKVSQASEIPQMGVERIICHVLDSRIQVSDHHLIEAVSRPLAIWAKPVHPEWGHLPFFARLVHELLHKRDNPIFNIWQGDWESCEDDIARELRPKIDLFRSENRFLLEELAVRSFTSKILKIAFGLEFEAWFNSHEAPVETLMESPEIKKFV